MSDDPESGLTDLSQLTESARTEAEAFADLSPLLRRIGEAKLGSDRELDAAYERWTAALDRLDEAQRGVYRRIFRRPTGNDNFERGP